MHVNELERQFKQWQKRVVTLQKNAEKARSPREIMQAASLELQTAWEELQVAQEELSQQHELLLLKNQQLIAALAAVERESQRYQELFEQAPNGYLVTNASGTILKANCAAAVLLNLKPQFLLGKPLTIFLNEEARPIFLSKLTQLTSTNSTNNMPEWEVHLMPRSDRSIAVALSAAVARDREGKVEELRWSVRDLTERKRILKLEQEAVIRQQVEQQLRYLSLHDPLTGLPNRTLFIECVEQALERAKQQKNYQFAILFLDVDRFKQVNDRLGHAVGDRLLIAIANRLVTCLRHCDTAARWAGDEFTILLEGANNFDEAIAIAERIQAKLKLPFQLGTQEANATVSIGIAVSTPDYQRADDLLHDADTAMYRAKTLGGAQWIIFHPEPQQSSQGIS